jgi:hypothetical protein
VKFKEIMSGRANQGLLDRALGGARGVGQALSGLLGAVPKVRVKADPEGELDIWTDHINKL